MKLVAITGGSRGLGKALVEQYSEDSEWHIVELSRSGTSKHNVHCDLADISSVSSLSRSIFLELAAKDWSEVVFINNAGDINPISSVGDLQSNEIMASISINQISPFILIKSFVEVFRKFSGRKSIVNLSSGAASKGYAGWSLYCASKAACENFINAIAVEEDFKEYPFVVVNYDPNVMDTEMQATIRDSDKSHFPAKERFIDYKISGKLLSPDIVASDLIKKLTDGMDSHNRYSVK